MRRPPTAVPAPSADVLVATADPVLAEAAGRWCVAVGATPEVVADVGRTRRSWRGAEVVLLGADVASLVAPVPRRDQVLVVASEPLVDPRAALAVGATAVLAADDDEAAVAALADALDGGRDGCVVAVVGAVGGAGSSTVAAVIATTAVRRGLDVVVVDDGRWGGGLDLVLGGEEAVGARWDDLDAGGGPLGARALRQALPVQEGVAVLGWSRERPLEDGRRPDLAAAVQAARRGFDLVVLDLPRHQVGQRADVLAGVEACVVLVPDDVRSIAAGRAVVARLDDVAPVVLAVSVDRPGGAGPRVVSDLLGRPVLDRVPASRRVRSAADAGRGPGSWRSGRRVAGTLLDLLGLDARPGAS